MVRIPVLAGLLATMLLASCTSGSDPGASPTPPAASLSGTPSPAVRTPTKTPVPASPKADACYRLRFDELARPTSSSRPVPCHKTHNAQTIFVGRLDTVVDGQAVAVDSDAVQQQMARTCQGKLDALLGGTAEDRDLSRFTVVWFNPTLEQSDLGAHWFRCDLIAFAAKRTLLPLLATGELGSVLSRSGALDAFGLCGTTAPGARNFQRMVCARSHSWRATSTISLACGDRYPGQQTVSQAGDSTCRDRVHAAQGFSLKFQYGWEWPTKGQWDRGQHYGFCWAPD